MEGDEKVEGFLLISKIPRNILIDNICDSLMILMKNQMFNPIRELNSEQYNDVCFDGEKISYRIAMPKGYRKIMKEMTDNEKNKICEILKNRLSFYLVDNLIIEHHGCFELLTVKFEVNLQ
jgi:hypothetical protein